VSKKEVPTYRAPSGTSTINLVFYRGDKLKLNKQEGLWTSKAAPIRKRIPIITNFLIETTETIEKINTENRPSRNLDQEIL
jgi:hypothetical protein